jgi:hypothetical protein
MTDAQAWHPDPIGEASWRLWDGNAWTGQVAPARETPDLQALSIAHGRSVKLDQQFGAGTDVLMCDETPVGLMHKPTFGEITVETAAGSWLFDRQGIITGRVRVVVQPGSQEIATFKWDGIGTGTDGTLWFPDGRWFRLVRTQELQANQRINLHDRVVTDGAWVWHGADNVPLLVPRITWPEAEKKTKKIFGKEIEYTSTSWKSGSGRTASDVWVDVLPPAANLRELPLLVLLGAFLVWWSVTLREQVWRD